MDLKKVYWSTGYSDTLSELGNTLQNQETNIESDKSPLKEDSNQ